MYGLKKFFSDLPGVSALERSITAALGLENIGERTEQLLTVKEMLAAKNKELNKFPVVSLLVAGASIVGLLAFSVAATSISLFGTILPVIGLAGAALSFSLDSADIERVSAAEKKINKEVASLMESHPQEVTTSPKFQQGIKAGFNYAAAAKEEAPTAPNTYVTPWPMV